MPQCQSSLLGIALLVLLTTSAAAPTPSDEEHGKVRQVIKGGAGPGLPAVVALEKTYKKYGWTVPPGLSTAAGAAREKVVAASPNAGALVYNKAVIRPHGGTAGTVDVEPEAYNAEYLAPITVGGQRLYMDIDTGSSDL